jgi:ribosome-associated protein
VVPSREPEPRTVAETAARLALSKKAEDIAILDLRGLSALCDYFVVATGTTDVHVRAIADHILQQLEKAGMRIWHVEGYSQGRWVLLDAVDVVIHVFSPDTRRYYALERLWGDAPAEAVGEEE